MEPGKLEEIKVSALKQSEKYCQITSMLFVANFFKSAEDVPHFSFSAGS